MANLYSWPGRQRSSTFKERKGCAGNQQSYVMLLSFKVGGRPAVRLRKQHVATLRGDCLYSGLLLQTTEGIGSESRQAPRINKSLGRGNFEFGRANVNQEGHTRRRMLRKKHMHQRVAHGR